MSERPRTFMALAVFLVLALAWNAPSADHGPSPFKRFAIRQLRIVGQSATLRKASYLLGGAQSAASFEIAEAYHNKRMESIHRSIGDVQLHWYWAELGKSVTSADITWYDIIEKRMSTMARLLREQGRDDFKVEKDKCEMYRFFHRNNLPTVPMIAVYNSTKSITEALADGHIFDGVKRWPVWLKACHLTQGSAKGRMMLKSREWVSNNMDELEQWINSKWVFRADDWERPWREDGNMLTDGLTPGMMLQESAELSYNPETKKDQIVELKTEVLWGEPYLAISPDIPGMPGAIFTQSAGVGDLMVFDGALNQAIMAGGLLPPDSWWHWILDEGHLNCVWDLARRSALLMGIECVRIDIFITKGKPKSCVINEDSISSGMGYGPYFEFLTKAWAEPHIRKRYQVYKSNVPVYMQTESDIPGLAARLRELEHDNKKHDAHIVENILIQHRDRNASHGH